MCPDDGWNDDDNPGGGGTGNTSTATAHTPVRVNDFGEDGYRDENGNYVTGQVAGVDYETGRDYVYGGSSKKQCILHIQYYANGGTGDPPSASVQTFYGPHDEVTFTDKIKDNDNFMTKSGYYFQGWATSADGSVSYYPGDEVTKTWGKDEYGTTKYKLYAKWRSTKLYVYMPDEHTNEPHYATTYKSSGSAVDLKGAIFTRTGYTQTGWATEAGGEKVYDLEQSVTPSSDSLEFLYPVWSPNTYVITFHANEGTGEDYGFPVVYDAEFTMPDVQYSRTGYHQDGWNEEADGSNSTWFSGWTYTYTRAENVDLYAVWAGDEYTVYYTDGTPNPTSANYIHSSKAVYGSPFYTDRVPYPEDRIYCSFNGWKADDNTVFTKQHAWFEAYSYAADPTWTLQRDLVIEPIWSGNYPFGKIFFAGKFSDEYDIYVEEPPEYTWPSYAYTHHKAFGKNGDILADPERYENVERVYKISAYDGSNYYNVAKKVSEWLHRSRSRQYLRLEDSYEPETYRLAIYEESNTLENVLAKAGKCEIKFNCKPQKFLNSGDKKIAVTTSGQIIHNPTDFPAKPLITAHGVGKITVNGAELEILQTFNNATFDAETYNAYDVAGRNMNRFVYTEDNIVLMPGDNVITFDEKIFDLFITPRWWTI